MINKTDFVNMIRRLAYDRNYYVYTKEYKLEDYVNAKLNGCLEAYNILFNTNCDFCYVYGIYIGDIFFYDNNTDELVEKIKVIPKDKLKEAGLRHIKEYFEHEKKNNKRK